jgi:hypothetical protein
MPEDIGGVRHSLQDRCCASSPGKHYIDDENYRSMLCSDSECSRRLEYVVNRKPHRARAGTPRMTPDQPRPDQIPLTPLCSVLLQ